MKNEYEGLTAEETAMVKGIKKTCPDCGAVNTLQWNDGLKASICGDCATIEAQQSNSVRHGDLIKRLNRRCRGGWVFKAAREGSALAQDFGRFYARVTHTGAIDKNIDLEHWGRKLGALRAGEVLAVPVEKCVSE
jgi:ribosomal protein S27AE